MAVVRPTALRRGLPRALLCALLSLTAVPALSAQAHDSDPGMQALLREPLAVSRSNFFHSALGIRPLQTARPLPPKRLRLRFDTSHAFSVDARPVGGKRNRFAGLFHEWLGMDLAWSPSRNLELGAKTRITGWDETFDRFTLFDAAGAPLVRYEAGVISGTGPASQRHFNLSDLFLDAKWRLWEEEAFSFSLSPAVKLPVGRAHDLTHAGTTDLSLLALASWRDGPLDFHLNLGPVFPLGGQDLFVPAAGVDLNPFWQGGAGVVWQTSPTGSAAFQIEGNTSAFHEVPFLNGDPLTALGGMREGIGNWLLEESLGVGLNPSASWDWMLSIGVERLF